MEHRQRGTLTRRIVVAAAVAICALALVPLALAAGSGKNSILSTYGGNSRPIVNITKPQHGSLGAGSGLPNTGLDVALVVAGGFGVAVLGLGLRRLGRRRSV